MGDIRRFASHGSKEKRIISETMSDQVIYYGEKVNRTAVLGPGIRAVLWVFGCCFDCPGCIAQNYRHGVPKTMTPAEMAEWFLSISEKPGGKIGLTISGGEPMMQAGPLALALKMIRQKRDTGVIVYTGFRYEELLEKAKTDRDIADFLSGIDLLIDGPYVKELDDSIPYRGSSNQRLIPLTTRYTEALSSYYIDEAGRKIELYLNQDKTMMVGVPGKDQAEIWLKMKQKSEPRSEQKPEQRLEQKPEHKVDQKPEPRSEQRLEQKSEQKPEHHVEQKSEPGSDQKTGQKSEQKPEQKPAQRLKQIERKGRSL